MLTGSAYPPPAILTSPATRSLGPTTVGATATTTFTVENVGGGSLGGTASTAPPFSIVSGGTYNLTANQSQSVTVGYAPTVAGTNAGTVIFTGGGGAANVIEASALVSAQPLGILSAHGTIQLSWPSAPTGFVLQAGTGLNASNWSAIPQTPTVQNGQNQVVLPISSGSNAFFRLMYPYY